jgi:hypothetical protein
MQCRGARAFGLGLDRVGLLIREALSFDGAVRALGVLRKQNDNAL